MEEIWKDKKDYEGLYQVSNLGRAKSLINNKGQYREKILKHNIRNGYPSVTLCKNKKLKSFTIHRLVAEAFIPNPNNLPCVNHKDENRLNNFFNNLEWCTYSYNINYGTGLKRRSITQSKPVLQYDKMVILLKSGNLLWNVAEMVIAKYMFQSVVEVNENIIKTVYGDIKMRKIIKSSSFI